MKKRETYLEGYLTVEASFVIPMAIMIIVLLLYWGFYCYDKSVSVQCSYLSVLRGSNEWELTNSQVEQLVEENLRQLTNETLLYTRVEELGVKVNLLEIEAEIKGGMDILFSNLRGDSMTGWEFDSKKSANRLKPTSYIRRFQWLSE